MIEGAEIVASGLSTATIKRFELYAERLKNWQAAHNLVAPSTLGVLWSRHFADSWQLSRLASLDQSWVDIGTGAGFPGLVVALAMMEAGASGRVELVEVNPRKIAFLREIIRETGAPARVHGKSIEAIPELGDMDIGVVTARAFTALKNLCALAQPFVDKGAVALFPKGQDIEDELTEATRYWNINYQSFPSRTAMNSVILRIDRLARKD